jgi:hypothetical protein
MIGGKGCFLRAMTQNLAGEFEKNHETFFTTCNNLIETKFYQGRPIHSSIEVYCF